MEDKQHGGDLPCVGCYLLAVAHPHHAMDNAFMKYEKAWERPCLLVISPPWHARSATSGADQHGRHGPKQHQLSGPRASFQSSVDLHCVLIEVRLQGQGQAPVNTIRTTVA
jgi:hypothetical protein